MTAEDDPDSLLRAVAAAPAIKPTRTLTAMVVRASDAAPQVDQWNLVRARIGDEAAVEERGPLLVLLWRGADHAERAAATALALRDVLPGAAIALATRALEPSASPAAAIDEATALLDATAIRIDDETARYVEPKFRVVRERGAAALSEPRATGTPARVEQTIGNYRIERLLGTGGMGVVYLAEHVTLGRKAVIKFVQERLSMTDEFAARFFIEAKTAASIRHPGIVDVFDYGHDERGRGYIVMEYLDGESLRARMRRESPLSVSLAVTLGTQIASALAAAHEAGIIHRDLKPDNVFLVRDPDSPHRVRAKVLDFGLAKLAEPDDRGWTRTGNFVGTPLYMSPEQCRGKNLDARTDIYSLGCMLYEMVCGRVPFLDETVGDLIIAHSSTPPTPPRSLSPALPAALERVIMRALAKSPADRQPSMAALGAELSALSTGDIGALAETAVAGPIAQRRRRWWPVAASVGVLAAGASVWTLRSHRGASPVRAGRSLALVSLHDSAARTENAWLSTALGDVVTSDLAASHQLHVTSAEEVVRMRTELGLVDVDRLSRDDLAKIQSDLGVDEVLAGTYTVSGDQLHVALALYDTTTGEVATEVTGDGNDLRVLGGQLAGEIEHALGVEPPTGSAGTVLPEKAAARDYADGLAKYRRYELVDARDALVKAAHEAPDDPLVHSALAATWQQLGYDANAATEAKLAFDHMSGLPKENRLAIEARYRETTQQWDQAIESYRTLFEFFPGRLDYGLELAQAQTHSGDAKGAYATLDQLRKLPDVGSDPRIELAESDAAEAADDIERERVHADRAVVLARKRGARVLLAQALFHEGWALWTLGRDAEAKTAYAEAKQIFTDLHDRSGLARCLDNIALAEHRDHHDDGAARSFEDALRLAKEAGDATAQAWILNNWAVMTTDEGDFARAVELYQQLLALWQSSGSAPSLQALAHANLAEILRWRGEVTAALEHCNQAEDLLRGLDARRHAAWAAYQLGEVLRAQDDLDGARKHLQQALGWASDVMTPAESAELRVSLARIEIDLGKAGDAEPLARAALEDLRAAKDESESECASAVLAEALAARGRVDDAKQELAGPRTGAASVACRLELDLMKARLDGDDATLRAVQERAAKVGFAQRELEARLARVALGTDDPRAVAAAAMAKGFKQIARRAAATKKIR